MDSFPLSEIDYAERVAMSNNRMDIETSTQPTAQFTQPTALTNDNDAVPNTSCQSDPSTMPVPPSAISYKANDLADPNLWDGHFGPVSLFGINKFLQNNTRNISCSLIHIAELIKQRCITNQDRNKIPQLDTFGEAAFTFILAIHKAGWDKLNITDKTKSATKSVLNQPYFSQEQKKNWLKIFPHLSQSICLADRSTKSGITWSKGKKSLKNHMLKSYLRLLIFSNSTILFLLSPTGK